MVLGGLLTKYSLMSAGRAEALLIAAYGKGLKTKEKECCMPDETREVLDEL